MYEICRCHIILEDTMSVASTPYCFSYLSQMEPQPTVLPTNLEDGQMGQELRTYPWVDIDFTCPGQLVEGFTCGLLRSCGDSSTYSDVAVQVVLLQGGRTHLPYAANSCVEASGCSNVPRLAHLTMCISAGRRRHTIKIRFLHDTMCS